MINFDSYGNIWCSEEELKINLFLDDQGVT